MNMNSLSLYSVTDQNYVYEGITADTVTNKNHVTSTTLIPFHMLILSQTCQPCMILVLFLTLYEKMGMEIRGPSPMLQRWQMAEPELSGLHKLDHF